MGVPTSRLLNPTGSVNAAVNPSFEFGGQDIGSLQLPKSQPIPFPLLPSVPAAAMIGAPSLTPQEIAAIQQRIMGQNNPLGAQSPFFGTMRPF